MAKFQPAYLKLQNGELHRRSRLARLRMESCDLCARYCRVNRLQTAKGAACRTGATAVVHCYGPHHGEEAPLSGRSGSGAIFFAGCNLRCVYCQNWQISQQRIGREATPEELASMMLELQTQGCHNINFVTPSHVVAQIIEALALAAQQGLQLPLVYNTGGYDSPEALRLLDGIIDIYMPDMKYGDSDIAGRHLKVRNYVDVNRAAVKEMHRQVGDLVVDDLGVAQRGLLIRHLVLPHNLAGSEHVFDFIARELSRDSYVNVMAQYHPQYMADRHADLNRPLDESEYKLALELAVNRGLKRLDR